MSSTASRGEPDDDLAGPGVLDSEARTFYGRALDALNDSGIPYLVGGAYAFERYTRIARHTKDFDIFARESDVEPIFEVLKSIGCTTELTFPHWLGKAFYGPNFIDVIYGSGNGVAMVDDLWFQHAVNGKVLDREVKLCPAEEMIWSKAYIMERERFDGADVAHLLHSRGEKLDWPRLIARFGPHWRVLLAHLILFHFIYPFDRSKLPEKVTQLLVRNLRRDLTTELQDEKVCYGPVISRQQYLMDVGPWGYKDGRLQPPGTMTEADIAHWTAAIDQEK